MKLILQQHHDNRIAHLIAEDLQKRVSRQGHIHGGDTITFTIISAETLTTKDYKLDIRPSCQCSILLLEDGREKTIPRAGGQILHVLLFEREDGELACRLDSKRIGADQRYKGTVNELPKFVGDVGLAIKFFLEYND